MLFFHLFSIGSSGVDIFFVISGFIISYSAGRYKGPQEAWQFVKNRFLRLNPLYYLATLIFLATIIHHKLQLHDEFLTLSIIIKSIILLPVFDRTAWVPTIMGIAWSLSFEWFFYLLFTLGIILKWRNKTAFLLITGGTLILIGHLLHSSDYRVSFVANPIMVEFLSGAVLYYCWTRWTLPSKVALAILLTGLGIYGYEIIQGIGWAAEAHCTIDGVIPALRLFYWGTPAVLLVTGCLFLEKNGAASRLWRNKAVRLLGDSSYSLYLIHPPVFAVLLGLSTKFSLRGMNPDLVIIILLLLAMGGGILFYQLIERPWLRYRRHLGQIKHTQ